MQQFINDIKNCKIFTKNCKKNLIIVTILTILSAAISSLIPSFTGGVINKILDVEYKNAIIIIIFTGFLEILLMITNLLITKNFLLYNKKFLSNIRNKTFKYVLNLQLREYQDNSKGYVLVKKIKNDSNRISSILTKIKEYITPLLSGISTIFIIFYINKIIGLFYLVCVVILLLIRSYGNKKSLYYKIKNIEILDEKSNIFGQIIKGAKDIKVLKMKDKFANKTENIFKEIGNLEYKSISYHDYADKIANFLESLFLGLSVLLSVILIKNKMMTTDDFVIIYMYKGKIFNFSQKFSNLIFQYKQFSVSLNRILSVMNCEAESFGQKELKTCVGKIDLKNVTFGYNKNEKTLQNLNISIKENTFTTIVGSSGAGKTTIFSLLTKIIKPDKGNVYLDNIDIEELDEKSIRDNISLVTQQPFLFNLSIKENLSIINEDFSCIKEACAKVGIHKKIIKLEKGYDTILDEDATNLSGGEKQRLAIARAILSNTKIILLDEITNNLDSKNVKAIIKLLKEMKTEYTIIMITHDKNITEEADRIIVLEKGCIVGDGQHQQLIENNKYYQKIYRDN